jgi:hypothetical protein
MRKVLTIGLVALFACAPAFAADTATPAATKATDTKAADTKTTNSQQSKMTTCQAEAGDKKLEGKARQDYVNNCLKAKPAAAAAEKPKSKMAMCNEKTKGMTKDEADKTRSECMKG